MSGEPVASEPPTPASQPPVVGWAVPSDDGLPVGGTISAGWALTRAHLGDLAAVAAIPMGLLTLTLLPIWISTTQVIEAWVRFFTETDFSQYAGDPEALRRDMDAIFQASTGMTLAWVLASGLSVVIGLVGAAAVTQATLDAARGREISVVGAFRAVADHASAIVAPALALAVASVLLLVPFALSRGSLGTGPTTPGETMAYLALTILGWVATIGLIYLVIRWAVVLQVILDEDLGLTPALARSSALTHGVRVRIAIVVLAAGFLVGLALSIPIWIAALVGWLATGSVTVGMGVYVIGIAIAGLIAMPFFAAMVTVIYDRRTAALTAVAPADATPTATPPG